MTEGRHGPIFTLSVGPTGSTPATQAAISRPVLYHYDPCFLEFYAAVVEKLRQAFGTAEVPVILQGEAVLGLEAAAASLISNEDIVLNLVSGPFGKGFGNWARRYAKEVIELEVPYDSTVEPASVRALLDARSDIAIVTAVHCETPSGTVADLDSIGPIVHAHGALLLVDAVSSFGGIKCDFELWQADLVVVAPQKCLGGSPGLSLLHVSDAAWSHMAANPTAPRISMLSILDWKDAHRADAPFPFTPSVSDLYALDAVLDQYLDEGPAEVRRRHHQAARATRAGGQALGLELWAADEATCSDTVTAFRVPASLDAEELRSRARRDCGVMLSGGPGELVGKVLIGHMGPSAYPLAPVIAVTALGRSMRSMGHPADVSGAVEAALRALDSDEAAAEPAAS